MTRLPWWVRVLLLFYPRRFRERHERDLLEAYRDAHLGSGAFAWDLVKNGIAVRGDRIGKRAVLPAPTRPAFFETLWQDVRFGVRSLVNKPAFAALALLTLTLGIGANTAIFSVVNWVVLRPLPYQDSDALVRVWWRPGSFNQRIVARFQEAESFESLSAYTGWAFTLAGEGEPEELSGVQVTTNHFGVLGVEPALGRGFVPEDSEPGRSDVVILSYGLWQRRYGGDASVLGRRIELSGAGRTACTVVGVLAASHTPVNPELSWQVWVPLERAADLDNDESWFLSVVARLAPGVPLERATAEVKTLARQVKQDWYPRTAEDEIAHARVEGLLDTVVGQSVRAQLWLLLGAVGIVLLVVCSNVASLLLARGTDREREFAMRAALGAGRRRLFRQLMTEHLVLGLIGGMLGAVAAVAIVASLRAHLPNELPRTDGLSVDARVLAFAALLALTSALVFGFAPALRSTGRNVAGLLRAGGARVFRRQRLQRILVVGEIGASVVLVVLAGLLVKSFGNLSRVDPGFEPELVFVLGVYAPDARYPEPAQRRRFFRELMPRLATIPGVDAVGSIQMLPRGIGSWDFPYYPEGRIIGPGEAPPAANFRVVSPGYFRSMGIPLLKGRTLREQDRNDAPPVGVINERLADETWPGEDPVGKEIHIFSAEGPAFTVVGVVGDVRQHGLDTDALAEMYRPLEQWTLARNFVTLRTELASESLAKTSRDVVWSMDPNVPVVALGPMQDVVSRSVATTRFVTMLLAVFAGIALFLTAVGVYGVTSYIVSQRTYEIGLRMALGARRSNVLRRAVSQGMHPVVAGMALGLACALVASKWVERFLFEVRATDPATFAGVIVFFGAVALAACYLPACRASRVDPMAALRGE